MTKKERKALADQLVSELAFYGPRKWLNTSKEFKEHMMKAILPEWAGGINFKHKDISASVNYDALRLKSIGNDARELASHTRDAMDSYIKWISKFDAKMLEIIPIISPTMWQKYSDGDVNKISNFNGMPVSNVKVALQEVSRAIGFETKRRLALEAKSNGKAMTLNEANPFGCAKISAALFTETNLTIFMANYLYQITNPDLRKSVIVIDYKKTLKELKSELSIQQNDFLKCGIPADYTKLFVEKNGYIKPEVLDILLPYRELESLYINWDEESLELNNKPDPKEGLTHEKYITRKH
jgi:hypothetical protein